MRYVRNPPHQLVAVMHQIIDYHQPKTNPKKKKKKKVFRFGSYIFIHMPPSCLHGTREWIKPSCLASYTMHSLAPARRLLLISSFSSQMIWVLGIWDATDTRLPSLRTLIASPQKDSGLPISTAPVQSAVRPGILRTLSAVWYLTHTDKSFLRHSDIPILKGFYQVLLSSNFFFKYIADVAVNIVCMCWEESWATALFLLFKIFTASFLWPEGE